VDAWGEQRLEGLVLLDRVSGARTQVQASGLFIMIGAVPDTSWLPPDIAVDPHGFVLTGDAEHARARPPQSSGTGRLPLETSAPGIFAAGDIRSGSVKRVAAAAGEGSVAVQQVHEYLAALRRREAGGDRV
jgi:thioredoxin reductase (NADPH)